MKKINLKKTVVLALAAITAALAVNVNIFAETQALVNSGIESVQLDRLEQYEIIHGCGDGNFYPERLITRAEMAQILLNIQIPDIMSVLSERDISGLKRYSDVPETHWAAKSIGIMDAYQSLSDYMDYADGYPDGTFKPDNNMTYAEVIKILVSIPGYKPYAEVNGGNPDGYLMWADKLGITNGLEFNPADSATRGDTAVMINNMLDVPILMMESFSAKDGSVTYTTEDGYTFEKWRYESEED